MREDVRRIVIPNLLTGLEGRVVRPTLVVLFSFHFDPLRLAVAEALSGRPFDRIGNTTAAAGEGTTTLLNDFYKDMTRWLQQGVLPPQPLLSID